MSKRTRLLIWVYAIAGIVLPITVHLLFKCCGPISSVKLAWSAGELLDYIAGMFGALATMVAVLLTIEDGRMVRLEEQRLSVVPLVAIALVEGGLGEVQIFAEKGDSDGGAVRGTSENHLSFRASDCDYIVVDGRGFISYPSALTKEQLGKASNRPFVDVEGPGGGSLKVRNDGQFRLLELISAGKGPAINVSVFLEANGETPLLEGSPLHLPSRQLLVGDSTYVGLLFEDYRSAETHGVYHLVIRYYDAMSIHQYEQRHKVMVRHTIDEGRSAIQIAIDLKISQLSM